MQQHDPLTWQVYGPRFERMDRIDETAQTICNTLHDLLKLSDQEQRATFLDAAFQMIESTRATTIGDIMGEKRKNLLSMISSSRELDPEQKKQFNKLVGLFVSAGLGNVIERYRPKKPEEKGETEAREAAEEEGRKEQES